MIAQAKKQGTLYISASQIETFELCNRKWWFEKARKLPTVQKPYFAFGTCLHGCLERWILSTATGRVPVTDRWGVKEWGCFVEGPFAGQNAAEPVELFPEGFETITEEDGSSMTLTPNEVKQIKRLVAQAIERGIVTKGDDVKVEHGFTLDLIEGVKIVGFLDLLKWEVNEGKVYDAVVYPEIHDHKSFGKSSTRYLAQPGPKAANGSLIPIVAPYKDGDGTSPNSVGHKQQNLTYAWATCMVEGYYGPVLVRHNQFPKFDDPKGVRFVEALLGPERLKAHGEYLEAVAADMVSVSKIKRWDDTPPPREVTACSEFGGCDFQDICGHRINTEVYSKRTERHNAERALKTRPNLPIGKTKTTMAKPNVFDKAKQQQAAKVEAAPAAKGNPFGKKVAPAPAAEAPGINSGAQQETPSVENGAPWGNPKCPACLGLGMNSKGNACPICDKTAAMRGAPTSGMYEIETFPEGWLAVARKEHVDAITKLNAPVEWTREKVAPAEAATAPKAALKPTPAAEPEAPKGNPFKKATATAPAASTAKKNPFGKAPAEPQEEAAPAASETTAKPNPFKRAAAQAAPAPQTEEEGDRAADEAPQSFGAPRGRGRPKGSTNRTPEQREAEAAQAAAMGPGRPRAGIMLLQACSMLEGPARPSIMAQSLLESVGAEMAADMGAVSFWELDQKKRQDRLKAGGKAIADRLGRSIVVFPGGTNDFDLVALFNALAPHAEFVFEGTR